MNFNIIGTATFFAFLQLIQVVHGNPRPCLLGYGLKSSVYCVFYDKIIRQCVDVKGAFMKRLACNAGGGFCADDLHNCLGTQKEFEDQCAKFGGEVIFDYQSIPDRGICLKWWLLPDT